MEGAKLALCKETLRFVVRELTATDRLSLVTFASEVPCVWQCVAWFVCSVSGLCGACVWQSVMERGEFWGGWRPPV
jgi:hypothetical protein